jgi:hypothetical protein
LDCEKCSSSTKLVLGKRLALLPIPSQVLVQLFQVDFKILRRNQQAFEPDGPHDAYFLLNRNQFSTANFASLEAPVHPVTNSYSCRLANILREGGLPFGSDYRCTHLGTTFAPPLLLFKSFGKWPFGLAFGGWHELNNCHASDAKFAFS